MPTINEINGDMPGLQTTPTHNMASDHFRVEAVFAIRY